MFRSNTSIFGDKATPWDTSFARRFLTISDEDKKILANIPGWSTEETEESQSNILEDQGTLPKRPNHQNLTEITDKSIEATNAGVLTANCTTTNIESVIKASTVSCIESPNTRDIMKLSTDSDIEIPTSGHIVDKSIEAANAGALSKESTANRTTTNIEESIIKASTVSCIESPNTRDIINLSTDSDIEIPTTGGVVKEVSSTDLEYGNKNTFMQSLSLYAKKVIDVFSGIHRRKRSKSLSDIHQAKYGVAMKLSKSETNLNDDSEEKEMVQKAFNNNGGLQKFNNSAHILNWNESTRTVNKQGLDLNNVEGNHIFTNTGSEIVKNVELPKTLDRAKVAELLNDVNSFFQNSKDSEGDKMLLNIGLDSGPCPSQNTDHEASLEHNVNMCVSDQSSSTNNNVKPISELIMLEDEQKNIPNKCLPDLICSGSLGDFSKDVAMEVESSQKPTENFINLLNATKSKKNTCPESATGNLQPVASKGRASCHPVIIHVSPSKSLASVLSLKKTANSNHIPLKVIVSKANLPSIEGEETIAKTSITFNFVKDSVEKEKNTSVVLSKSHKEDIQTTNDDELMHCVEKQDHASKATNSTGIAVNGEGNLPSVNCVTIPINAANTVTESEGNPIASQEIFVDTSNSTDKALKGVQSELNLLSSNLDQSYKTVTSTQRVTSQTSIGKGQEDKDLVAFTQIKDAVLKTPTYSRNSQNYRKSSIGTVLEPCGTVENTLTEPEEAVFTTKVNELTRTNSVALVSSKPKMHSIDPNSIEVVDLTEGSSRDCIVENVSKDGASNKLATKRKRQSKDKPRKKSSLGRSQVQIQYSGDELRKIIHLMKLFQSGKV